MIVERDREEGVKGVGVVPVGFDPVSLAISTGIQFALLGVTAFLNRKGPQQKVQSTSIVNEAEPLLKQNLTAWQTSTKTAVEKQLVLEQFDKIWGAVVASCNVPELGTPGQNCVKDRQRGGKWDWFSYYRDPIANDPVHAPTATVTGNTDIDTAISQLGFGVDWMKIIIPLGVVAVGLFVLGGDERRGRG